MKPLTHMDNAKKKLDILARVLVARHRDTFWEDETRKLPWDLRRLRRRYKAFCDQHIKPLALAVDDDVSRLDKDKLFCEYARQGFASELLPPPFGTAPIISTLRFGALHVIIRAEEMGAADGGMACILGCHDLGMAPLFVSGSLPAYFRWALPIYQKLMKGEKQVAAFAITEPGAGSDVEETHGAQKARVTTRARKVEGGYVINGSKVFITNGALADYYTLFACLEDGGMDTWTCFMVERTRPGVSLGRVEKKMGQKAGDAAEMFFEDVFVPTANRIGRERSGFAINRLVLNASRPAVAGIAIGIARSAFEHCFDFCKNTKLGPKYLLEYQDVQLELAEMFMKILAARSLNWNITSNYLPPMQSMSSAAKCYGSDVAVEVCRRAMDIMGDHAYVNANSVEKIMRDSRVTQIYEGSNQIQRLSIVEDLWEKDFRHAV